MRLWFAQLSLEGIGIPTLHKTLQPIYNKQGPTAQQRKFCSIFCNNLKRKWRESCSVVSDSLRPRLTGFSVQRILQARILEWVAVLSSRGSSQPRDRTLVSCISGGFFTSWATREIQGNKWEENLKKNRSKTNCLATTHEINTTLLINYTPI